MICLCFAGGKTGRSLMSICSSVWQYFLPYFKASRAVFGRRFAYRYSLYLSQLIEVVVSDDCDEVATAGI